MQLNSHPLDIMASSSNCSHVFGCLDLYVGQTFKNLHGFFYLLNRILEVLNGLLVKGRGNITSGRDLDRGQSMQNYRPVTTSHTISLLTHFPLDKTRASSRPVTVI